MRVSIPVFSRFFNNALYLGKLVANPLIQKIGAVRDKILMAYREPSKKLPELAMPPHREKNTYPKEFKKIKWPTFLDNVVGYTDKLDYKGAANKIEPLEKVTALHAVAMRNNNVNGALRLIADGADVHAKDIRGQTPAYWAAYHGSLEVLNVLKIYGAKLDHQDFRGKTPLRAAAKYGHDNVIAFLASHKVGLDVRDGRGMTALHVAAFHGRFAAYENLICFGADTTLKDNFGRTAEEILRLKCADIYHRRSFWGRLIHSPEPPTLNLRPYKLQQLNARAK